MKYTSLDAGLLWEVARDVTVGLMGKNIIDLHKSGYTRTTTGKITQNRFSMPLISTLAVSVKRKTWQFSCDQEFINGHFGGVEKKKAELWLMRAGVEKTVRGNKFLRAGLIAPVIARTSTLGNIRDDLPNPKFGITLGAGIAFRHFKADLAITGNPGRSYVEQAIRLQAILSITVLL